MDLDVVFLGTAGAVPTARRGAAATLVRRGGDRLLIDCGEGTQRQLLRSGTGLVDVDAVFVTHLHADHFLGLPGMLKTFALRGRERPLAVYGPRGLRELVRTLARVFGRLSYPLDLVELDPGRAVVLDGYRVEPVATDHGVASLGFALVEDGRPGRFDVAAAAAAGVPPGPLYGELQRGLAVTLDSGRVVAPGEVVGPGRAGRRVVFSGDTRPCPALVEAAAAADLLVLEATFMDAESERARETGHTTALQAARLAASAQVSLLALTHLSQRSLPREIAAEARTVFPGTVVPRDFDLVEVPFRERGEPRLVRAADRPVAAAGAGPASR
ncbi:MAG TPA: ribonuclease Z [Gaiellales bacterium]|nr:ribonuclease Z [Gaiellales bacterium]